MGLIGDIGSIATGGVSNVIGAISGSGASGNLLGDAVTGGAISNLQATNATNAAQIQLSQQQMDYETQMSNTSYQRAVADMKAAGLNPMLAYSQGGASVPNYSVAQLQTPQPGAIGAGLASTAYKAAGLGNDLASGQASRDLQGANTDLANAQADKASANAVESGVNADVGRQTLRKLKADTSSAQDRARQEHNNAAISDASVEASKRVAPYQPYMEAVGQALGLTNSALKIGRPGFPGSSNSQDAVTRAYERGTRAGSAVK